MPAWAIVFAQRAFSRADSDSFVGTADALSAGMNFTLRGCVFVAVASALAACGESSNVGSVADREGTTDAGVDAVADAPIDVAASCVATFDFHDNGMAHTICDRDPTCVVCVQNVDAQGNATTWLAQQNAPQCPCPKVTVESTDGGSDAATDGRDDASNDASADGHADVHCIATADIADKSMAQTICGSDPNCVVCVQKVDAQGNATTWLAQQNAPSCPCPSPAGP